MKTASNPATTKVGRPKSDPGKFKQSKAYRVAGQQAERLENMRLKQQDIQILAKIIAELEKEPEPDFRYIRKLSARANILRDQLRCLSLVDVEELECLEARRAW